MTPQEFIKRWLGSTQTERAAAQTHFLDLCEMLGVPKPADLDPTGKDYGFEVGATKTTGGQGFADVFRRGFFAWEYKGTGKDLTAAFAQLQRYAVALDNPPLLIVSDIGTTIRIHTNWNNSVSQTYEIPIAQLGDPDKRRWLLWALTDPDQLRPTKTRQQLTEEVAAKFAELARSLRARGHNAEQVAHFINRLIFCMFAEDVKLLPNDMFTRMLEGALNHPSQFETFARSLFAAMSKGGLVGFEQVKWFNGGLFDDDSAFALNKDEIRIVHEAAQYDWGEVDPSILGTLFERGLDPDKRSQLGAHYTDREKIMQIVNPVIVEPLTAEWEAAKGEIANLMAKAELPTGELASPKEKSAATTARNKAEEVLKRYLKRLADFRVLDPACGSGNFLFLALKALKDLEHRAQVEAEAMGLPRAFPQIGPEVVRGIEINPYAAELARVSVWVGEIQWMLRNGFAAAENPILKPLDNIECRDALITRTVGADGSEVCEEAEWPQANAIIGNPPFLGTHKQWDELGQNYVEALRAVYRTMLPGNTDLVAYWFEKAWALLQGGRAERAGLVATNSIRGGANRRTLDKIVQGGRILEAWSDEEWTVEGAAVRVSLVCFVAANGQVARLDGKDVSTIFSDLTASSVDLTKASRLAANTSVAYLGTKKGGPFDLDGSTARAMLAAPTNPNGRRNADIVLPRVTGGDIARRRTDRWVIDFGHSMTEAEAALYQLPFQHVVAHVKPVRDRNKRQRRRDTYWLHSETAPGLRTALAPFERYVGTPRVSRYRLFVWLPKSTSLDDGAVAIARDDDTAFGILHSRFHELWALSLGTWLGVGNDPRYTPTTTFETFPFPDRLSPDIPAADYASDPRAMAIAEAARKLNEYRENWLNPSDLVQRVPEVVTGYPDRILPKDAAAEEELRARTLTNLYNERPAWLDNAHKALDAAVAAAYGWPADLTDDEILARLFALNQERAGVAVGAAADGEESTDEDA